MLSTAATTITVELNLCDHLLCFVWATDCVNLFTKKYRNITIKVYV